MAGRRNVRLVLTMFTWGVLLGAVLLLAVAADVARADPGALFVSQTGSGTVCSQPQPCDLQAALGRAADGDVLYVAAGTYTGAGAAVINVTRSISLYGGWSGAASGPVVRDPAVYRSVLDGQGQRRVVFITGTLTTAVDGFTIQRGNASSGPQSGWGGGIYSSGATPLVAHNIITGNVASTIGQGWGGGIYAELAPHGVTVRDNQVLFNMGSTCNYGGGGGMQVSSSPSSQIINNVVLSNTGTITGGGYGGGIGMWECGGSVMTGNRVEWNLAARSHSPTAGGNGGGIYCESSDGLFLANNAIRSNVAAVGPNPNGSGGGLFLGWMRAVMVSGNHIEGNIAAADTGTRSGSGGAAYLYKCGVTLQGNRLIHNTASLGPHGYGGAVHVRVAVEFTMVNNVVAANHASQWGGGMSFEAYGADSAITGTLLHNTFAGNDLGSGNGGSAIYVDVPWVTLALTNNIIYNHTYGVYASAGNVRLQSTLFFGSSGGDTTGPGIIANIDPVTGQDPLLNATYHLRAGSPAIDRGVDAGVRSDIDGQPRPVGAGYDIGADEFGVAKRVFLPRVMRAYTR
jgi:fibronectin-binding autotransporter adhesin